MIDIPQTALRDDVHRKLRTLVKRLAKRHRVPVGEVAGTVLRELFLLLAEDGSPQKCSPGVDFALDAENGESKKAPPKPRMATNA